MGQGMTSSKIMQGGRKGHRKVFETKSVQLSGQKRCPLLFPAPLPLSIMSTPVDFRIASEETPVCEANLGVMGRTVPPPN